MTERRMDLFFPDLAAAARDVQHAREAGYQLTGNWNLAQILDHLNRTMRMTFEGAPFKYPAPLRLICRLALMPMIRGGKPTKVRGKAPAALTPPDEADESDNAEEFYRLVNKLTDPTTPFVALHPVFGKFTREQWLLMQKWHAAHHLSFVVPTR